MKNFKLPSHIHRLTFFYLALIFLIFCLLYHNNIQLLAIVSQNNNESYNQLAGKKLLNEQPNIILVVIDSLRPDHLSYFGYRRATSPYIDELCRKGIIFSNVIAQSSQTGPAIASLWTGLFPYRHGIQLYSYNQSYDPLKKDASPFLSNSFKTMAEYLRENGYSTMAFIANPWLQPDFGFAQGFDLYMPILSNNGEFLIEEFKKVMEEVNPLFFEPFFAYIHVMDTHAPYINPSGPKNIFVKFRGEPVYGMGFKDEITNNDLAYAIGLYDEQIRYVDGLICQLLNFIKEKAFRNETVFILMPDHGEEFFEHFGLGHGMTLYNEVINIFLLLYSPALFPPKRIEDRIQAVDLLPSLLDLLEISYDEQLLDGKSFLPIIASSASFPSPKNKEKIALSELGDKKAIIKGNYKYIYNIFLQTEELYDLSCDPRELFNLVDKEKNQREKLQASLFSMWLPPKDKNLFNPPSRLLKENIRGREIIIEKLKSLGYISVKTETSDQGEASLTQPISDEVNFSSPTYNRLQLIYGWKEKILEGNTVFYKIGPWAKFALRQGDNFKEGPKELQIEGKISGNLPENFAIRLEVHGERRLLGRTKLEAGKNFLARIMLPRKFFSDRTGEFTLTWCPINKKTGETAKALQNDIAFLISRLSLKVKKL